MPKMVDGTEEIDEHCHFIVMIEKISRKKGVRANVSRAQCFYVKVVRLSRVHQALSAQKRSNALNKIDSMRLSLAYNAPKRENAVKVQGTNYCMSDLFFYPVALLAALAIIAGAALPGRDRLACGSVSGAGTNYQNVEVVGDDLCRMVAAGQSDIDRVMAGEEISSLIITAGAGMLGDRPERNPHFRLAADLEQQFAGRRVRVTVEAKPTQPRGALAFEMNYSAGQEGNSGWQLFNLTPEYRPYSFVWNVPPREGTEQAIDYLSIRPIVPEGTRGVEIRSVRFERLPD